MEPIEKHHFRLKGKNAEELIHELALNTFLGHWSFLNPKLPSGNELCDLLVVYGDVAIIWQIKNVKIDDTGQYNVNEVEKNLRQLSGARRQLFDLKAPILLKNIHERTEHFNASNIKKIFLISAFTGEGQISTNPLEEFKKYPVHVLTGNSTDYVLNELDTISDFVEYLIKREELFLNASRIVIFGGEEEILAYYLLNDRNFSKLLINTDAMIVLSDCWEKFSYTPEYKAKQQADKLSYFWDSLIDNTQGRPEDVENYERIAREMARLNRFQRRVMSDVFLEARLNAHNNKAFRRMVSYDGTTYCFLFQDDLQESGYRIKVLAAICHIGRSKYQHNKKVIGIATEPKIQSKSSYDFILINNIEWTEKDQLSAVQLQKKLGFFEDAIEVKVHKEEYPKHE